MTDVMPEVDEIDIAIHEAGHAVSAIWLGLRFQYVTIKQRGEAAGRIQYWRGRIFDWEALDQEERDRRIRPRLERKIISALAGPMAEHKWSGLPRNVGDQNDLANAASYARFLCGDRPGEATAYLSWLSVRAENLLNTPGVWEAVKSVAWSLLDRHRLTESDVREYIQHKADWVTALASSPWSPPP